MSTRARIGDVIEFKTAIGLAYAQYTHEHKAPPRMGSLIRVLEGTWPARPVDLSAAVDGTTRFHTFVSLNRSIRLGLAEVVGHRPVPPQERRFPVFRNGIPDPATGKVTVWWLWDGAKQWRVGELTPEQMKMPLLAVRTIPLIVLLIEQG